MNILVTGANGQLGQSIRRLTKNVKDHYIFADINDIEGMQTLYLDITSQENINKAVDENNIDAIINCAAFTNVDAAEDNVEMATRLNVDAPRYLASAMKRRGGLLIHISTDYVFGQEQYNTPCREDMKGTPTGVYGDTKLQGERTIIEEGCNYLIFRTAWLYSEYGKNFCKTMLQLTSSRDEVKVVFDQVGTPTYALDLARTILKIVDKRQFVGHTGIYNYSNEGVCSWYDFAFMVALLAKNDKCRVKPCHSSEYPSKVIRPAYSVLDKTKIKETFAIDIPHWTYSLAVCVANILGLQKQQ